MWRSTAMGMGQQRGLALFMSLVMLLILTILGVSSVQNTSLQERMSRNALDSNLAFQAAESALRDGEDFIEDNFNSLVPFDAPGAAPLASTTTRTGTRTRTGRAGTGLQRMAPRWEPPTSSG